MDKKEEMKKMVEQNRRIHASFETTIKLLLPYIKFDIPKGMFGLMVKPVEAAYESSKHSFNAIELLQTPQRELALSNFMFGLMFGKTELLLQILKRGEKNG
ncbi:MAG: hypothetical protein JJE48_06710 [Actinobacteria bacterium]|nr:hypothetical protein [Actinomycetota bacterium]